jgi:hypothetical protein
MLPYLGPEMIELLLEWCRRPHKDKEDEWPTVRHQGNSSLKDLRWSEETKIRNRFLTNVLYVQTRYEKHRALDDDQFLT